MNFDEMMDWLERQQLFYASFKPEDKITLTNLPEVAKVLGNVRRVLARSAFEPIKIASYADVLAAILAEVESGRVTFSDIADYTGIDNKTISKYLSQQQMPKAHILVEMLLAAHLTIEVHHD